jgi:hypothetical protein
MLFDVAHVHAVEGNAAAGRELDLDDVEGRPGRRDVAAQVARCRIAPGRLCVAAGERACGRYSFGEQRRERDAQSAADLVHQLRRRARFPAFDA